MFSAIKNALGDRTNQGGCPDEQQESSNKEPVSADGHVQSDLADEEEASISKGSFGNPAVASTGPLSNNAPLPCPPRPSSSPPGPNNNVSDSIKPGWWYFAQSGS